MKILMIGDIVGSLGRKTAKRVLTKLKKSGTIALVVANADNLAHGRGATTDTIKECIEAGVDVFTSGDHIFDKKDFLHEVQNLPIARPANFYKDTPGKEYQVVKAKGCSFCVISLIGETFGGGENVENPFFAVSRVLNEIKKNYKNAVVVVDLHGDLTSQKVAMGYFLDGKVTAVVGTHTHIPTADGRILEKGTAYITDLGMTGIRNGVLGVKKEIIIERFLSSIPSKFEWEDSGEAVFNSVLIDVNEETGKALSIERKDFVVKESAKA